jgi:hypothetical protein
MGLCDWQCVAMGNWSRDFAYAIAATLTVNDRREWERDLLKLYLEKLQQAGGQKIEFDDAWLLYRQQLFCALVMWTPTLKHSRFMPAMQPERVSLEMIKRITSAIDDLDSMNSF